MAHHPTLIARALPEQGPHESAARGAESRSLRHAWRMMRSDLARVVAESTEGRPVGALRYWSHLAVPSAFGVLLFRCAHWAHACGWRRLAAAATLLNQRLCGLVMHPASRIGPGLFIAHPAGVTFCGTAGARLSLYPASHVTAHRPPGLFGELNEDCPRLGNDVRIGTLAVVAGGVAIGDGALIGVQVVVDRDVPAGIWAQVRQHSRVVRPAHGSRADPQQLHPTASNGLPG